ncbi:MMPL family transporter [Reyranella sp.]|uniref:MMPL family transporter n=1 Tax=Reyranella sp. TaxID=1929291 RepID=UPI002F956419
MSTRPSLTGRIVAISTRYPLLVLLLAAGLTLAALVFTAQHFAMTADTAQLISTKLKWRQRELAFEAAFPQLDKLTMVVVDGATPELADDAAKRLAAALRERPDLFRTVRRPDGGPFFDHNGLLLLPLDDVRAVTTGLVQARPLLGALATDPSLRGVLATLSNLLEGIRHGQGSLRGIEPMTSALAETFEKTAAGQPAFFSWQTVIRGSPAEPRETRHIVLVQPVMDYTALEPGAAASDAIRRTAESLGLDGTHGVTLRLTGPVPLADEEFASLAEDAHLVLGAMVAALLGILWLAVRSVRVVIAIVVTTIVGLVMTAAIGLLATGRFNLISVAFIPLFVGLGVDFSIQFSVRSLAERLVQPDIVTALIEAGESIGRALALSAAAIGVGFFAFLPTSYIGVAELGTIAGLGMIVAFGLSIVLLPALLALLRFPPARMAEVGFTMLAPVDGFVTRHRRGVLVLALVAAVASAALLPLVRFDFNPLNLKSPKAESMTTLQALASDPDWTPNAINVLAPSLARSQGLAQLLEALPEVSRTVTLQSFVPAQQDEKLALIRGAAALVEPALEGATPRSPPSDAELIQELTSTAAALRTAAADAKGDSASASARRLAEAIDRLVAATPEVRARAAAAVTVPLHIMLGHVSTELKARPVTIESLPSDLVADWITKDGRARIQVLPQGDRDDNESLRRFATVIQTVAPDATGRPISTSASGDSVVEAFMQAGLYSIVAIVLLLAVVLRRARDVVLTMLPVLLSGLLTFATCGALDLPLNFTNIIALPLLFGVGVAFNIYFVAAWRAGETAMLKSSLMRAVVFSALTTANAFGALWLSTHPGTASMGRLLMISLGWELLVTLLFRPALLARSPYSKLWF